MHSKNQQREKGWCGCITLVHGRTGYGVVESCIQCRKLLQHNVHASIHTNMVIQWWGGKKQGNEVCFPHIEISFSLGSCACTKLWDINKCPTNQHKKQVTTLRVEKAGERWAPISIQDWSWPGLDSDISQISFGKSPRATALSGVSDLARCRLRTSPHRLV